VPDPRHDLGLRAEEAVARWLVASGWTLLERRWRCPAGELDLVLRDPAGAMVGVEVKLRRTGRAGSGPESVDPRRVKRLRAALFAYASVSPRRWAPDLRLDLVAVTPAPAGRWRLRRVPAIDAW
jgi:putative endonuclease